jgi:hypothetical protein
VRTNHDRPHRLIDDYQQRAQARVGLERDDEHLPLLHYEQRLEQLDYAEGLEYLDYEERARERHRSFSLQERVLDSQLSAEQLDSMQGLAPALELVDCQEGGASRSGGGAGGSRSGERGGASRSGGAKALERLQERVDYEERAEDLDWLQERVRSHTLTLAPTLPTNSL